MIQNNCCNYYLYIFFVATIKLTWHVLFLQLAKMKVAIVNLDKIYLWKINFIASQSPRVVMVRHNSQGVRTYDKVKVLSKNTSYFYGAFGLKRIFKEVLLMEQELAYSFHLGSDKNKSKLAKKYQKIMYLVLLLFPIMQFKMQTIYLELISII